MAHPEAPAPPICPTSQAVTTAESATRLPTERSIPAVMMTMVMPMAMMAMTLIWLATLRRLSGRRNVGQRWDGGVTRRASANPANWSLIVPTAGESD